MSVYSGNTREYKVDQTVAEMRRRPDAHLALEAIELVTDDANVLAIVRAYFDNIR